MSRRPRRSRHRAAPVPWYTPAPVVLDEAYEREVEASTEKLQRLFARAERRALRAESRLKKAQQDEHQKTKRHVLDQLELALQARREELERYRRMMIAIPASTAHRNRGTGVRPVPINHGNPL